RSDAPYGAARARRRQRGGPSGARNPVGRDRADAGGGNHMSWFPPPEPIASRVFTRMPDKFRHKRRTPWADFNHARAEIDSFLEGPSFDRDGNLFVTDIPFGRVFRIDRGGAWSLVAEYAGWPNGLKIAADGRIFITDYDNGLMRLDPASGQVTPHYTHV